VDVLVARCDLMPTMASPACAVHPQQRGGTGAPPLLLGRGPAVGASVASNDGDVREVRVIRGAIYTNTAALSRANGSLNSTISGMHASPDLAVNLSLILGHKNTQHRLKHPPWVSRHFGCP
jgi:hypothetical protein